MVEIWFPSKIAKNAGFQVTGDTVPGENREKCRISSRDRHGKYPKSQELGFFAKVGENYLYRLIFGDVVHVYDKVIVA